MARRLLGRTMLLATLFALLFSHIGLSFHAAPAQAQASSSQMPAAAQYAPANTLALLSVGLDRQTSAWQQALTLGQRLGIELSPQWLIYRFLASQFNIYPTERSYYFGSGEMGILITDPTVANFMLDLDDVGSDDPSTLRYADPTFIPGGVDGVVVVITAPDIADSLPTINDYLRYRLDYLGGELESTTYKGVKIASVGNFGLPRIIGISVAFVGNALLLATNPQDLEPVIDVQVGDTESLASNPSLPQMLDALPGDSVGVGIVNGPALAAYTGSIPQLSLAVAPANGLLNAVSAFTISAQDAGFVLDSRTMRAGDAAPNLTTDFASRMPVETEIFVTGSSLKESIALNAVIGTAANLFFYYGMGTDIANSGGGAQATPPNGDEMIATAYAGLATLLGMNIGSDLIGQLDGEYSLGIWGTDGGYLGDLGAAFIGGTSNPDQLRTTVNNMIGALTAITGDAFTSAGTDDGTVLQTFEIDTSDYPDTVAVGVIGNELQVMLGDQSEMGFLGSLATNTSYTAVVSQLPAERTSLLYIDIGALNLNWHLSGSVLGIAGFRDGDMDALHGLYLIPAYR